MLDADTVMKQAGWTAKGWMIEAAEFVETYFEKYTNAERAVLIAAYTTAASNDEIAMSLRGVGEAMELLPEALRSDHPLQGETLGGIQTALEEIAESIHARSGAS